MADDPLLAIERALGQVDALVARELNVKRLRDTIGASDAGVARTPPSDDNNQTVDEEMTPDSIEADLAHYKDLFSKLRFSYTEQVTKERFLSALTHADPVYIEPADNDALEKALETGKPVLQAKKTRVQKKAARIGELARAICERFEAMQESRVELESLRSALPGLVTEVDQLSEALSRASADDVPLSPGDADADDAEQPARSLAATRALIESRLAELSNASTEAAHLADVEVPQAEAEAAKAEADLARERAQRDELVAKAEQIKTAKEKGGLSAVEESARWHDAAVKTLDALLG